MTKLLNCWNSSVESLPAEKALLAMAMTAEADADADAEAEGVEEDGKAVGV